MQSMLKASLTKARTHMETGLAIASFGTSSVYWLALAFFMSAPDYGRMMTLQASIMLVSTALTFRTHDLLFFLKFKLEVTLNRAFRTAMLCEISAALLILLVCTVGALAFYSPQGNDASGSTVAIIALLIAIGTMQGACIAKLRFLRRGDVIARADILTMIGWAGAYMSFVLLPAHRPQMMLLIGSTPNALRTLALAIGARSVPHSETEGSGVRQPLKVVLQFLSGAQVTNFLKNGAISIETMLLAAFLTPTSVALYRLARSTQGATSAAINVEYQRSYSALARSQSGRERGQILASLNRRSTLICLILYPISALFALVYAMTKPDIGIVTFQLVTLGTFLSFVPAALQQGYFAALSLHGDHRSVNIAYITSMATLLAVSGLLLLWPSMTLFILAVLLAAILRLIVLARRARRDLES
jgi:hypothetical protein